jgi:hypothetical protein
MVLTPGYIKVITKAIASQIITELKKPLKKSFNTIEPAGVCKVSCSGKDALIDYLKDNECRAHQKKESWRKMN